jgi:hypothetical protein
MSDVKALELDLFDPRTDRPMRATYDASIITGVQEMNYGGRLMSQIIVAGVNALNVDEPYESLRNRWLAARDDQAMIPIASPARAKKPVIVS